MYFINTITPPRCSTHAIHVFSWALLVILILQWYSEISPIQMSNWFSYISILQKSIVPRLKSWIRKVVDEDEDLNSNDKSKSNSHSSREVTKSNSAREATEAAKTATLVAVEAARASQELLNAKKEGHILSIFCLYKVHVLLLEHWVFSAVCKKVPNISVI
jgi:hypothetical protein